MAAFLKCMALVYGSLCFSLLSAKDLGTRGHLFPIQEMDMLVHLQQCMARLSPEERATMQQQMQQNQIRQCQEPSPVEGIEKATVYKSYFYDPTVRAKEDVRDHEGKLIVRKGATFNPLENCILTTDLLFLDATDPAQIAWAKLQGKAAHWVLVRGRPLDLEKEEKRPVYFDQNGSITDKFHIRYVPARVSQSHHLLMIEEIPLPKEEK